MYKIAICITTFLRDTLLFKTLQNIVDNYPENCILLIADQGYHSNDKDIYYDYIKKYIPCEVYYLPFDSGLSYGRNFLVNKALEMNIPYCLISADSIQFKEKYDFDNIISFLMTDEKYALCGFELEGSKCPWEYDIFVDKKGIHLIYTENYIEHNSIKYKKVDICRNIFLARTKSLTNLWDNEMKLGEHELAFIELKNRGFQSFWTNAIKMKREANRNTDEYEVYRNRFGYYQKLLKQKLNIKNWVIYEK